MKALTPGNLALAGALALALGAGVASAASPDIAARVGSIVGGQGMAASDHGGVMGANLFEAAATYIGISVDQLRTELGTDKSLADVAIAHGKTRDGLIAALQQAVNTNIATFVDQKGMPGRGPMGGGPGLMIRGNDLSAAATYLGISEADLRAKLQAGQTPAQIATATAGKSRDGLIKALTDAANAAIDKAQADGKLTADQATQAKSHVADEVTRFIDSARPAGAPGFPGGPRGHR